MSGIDLGDKRLNKRSVKVLGALADKPGSSIPDACGGLTPTIAAYRFFDNKNVDWQDLLEPHMRASQQRMAQHKVVLCIQDTTELDYNGQQMDGLGPLSYPAQRGLYLHPTYAVTPEREPLGVLDAWMWARPLKDAAKPPEATVCESTRWTEGYERIAERAPLLPNTRLVYVADREADIKELMMRARDLQTPADWLIRCKHNRNLPGGDKLFKHIAAIESIGAMEFTLPPKADQKARHIVQELRICALELPDGKGGVVQANCVVATQVNAVGTARPLEWKLLTNRSVTNLEQAMELLRWYCARWEIEMFFQVLKCGCKVEALQLGSKEKLERALVMYMVVAWRVANLMRLGRTCPDMDACQVFEPGEWQAAYILNDKKPPKKPPRLNEVIRLIGRLGGHLGRKSDGEPGAKTMWQGMQRLAEFVAGLKRWQKFAGAM